MLILLDQDNVLADFERGFLEEWQIAHPDKPSIAYHERRTFNIREDYPAHLQQEVQSIYLSPGFFRNLQPIPGALEAVREIMALGHDIRICTSPLNQYHNCVKEKYEWVETHLGHEFTQRLILTKDKTFVHGDILIDDKPEVTGLNKPTWKHYLFDSPYNRSVMTVPRIDWQNWKDVLPLLG